MEQQQQQQQQQKEQKEQKEEEYKPKRSTVPMLARLYKVHERTIRRELVKIRPKIGEKKGHFLTIEQVVEFVKHYGRPFLVFFGIVKSSETTAADAGEIVHHNVSAVAPSVDPGVGFFHPVMLVISGLISWYNTRGLTTQSAYYGGAHKSTDIARAKLMLSIISIISATFLMGYYLGQMIF